VDFLIVAHRPPAVLKAVFPVIILVAELPYFIIAALASSLTGAQWQNFETSAGGPYRVFLIVAMCFDRLPLSRNPGDSGLCSTELPPACEFLFTAHFAAKCFAV